MNDKLSGSSVIGMIPLSWRNPEIVSHAMAQSLDCLFYTLLQQPRNNQSLKAIIRDLGEPVSLYKVFSFKYYANFISSLGYSFHPKHVWFSID